MSTSKIALLLFVVLWLVPIAASALVYARTGIGADWWIADRSSAGLLPNAARHPDAVVRILAAPTVRWRGIVAVHCWIVVKAAGASRYTRYDYTAWGDPIRVDGFAPDGRWFGRAPEVVFAADGAAAEAIIPRMRAAIEAYRWNERGHYRAWPGPNSNTFVQAVMEAVPEAGAVLPPTAVGKDYPHDGSWAGLTPSRTGFRATLGGYAGVTLGWVEGLEVSLLGGVVGLDLRRPAIKLPGFGRIGMPVVVPAAVPAVGAPRGGAA